jgi:hypothetical protein
VSAPTSLRHGEAPAFWAVDTKRLSAAIVELVRQPRDGKVAVIVPPDLARATFRNLDRAGCDVGLAAADGLQRTITVLAAEECKGMEFDEVIVVEPARIAGAGRSGLRLLFVALTRATKRLDVLHSEPLPRGLRSGVKSTVVDLPRRARTRTAKPQSAKKPEAAVQPAAAEGPSTRPRSPAPARLRPRVQPRSLRRLHLHQSPAPSSTVVGKVRTTVRVVEQRDQWLRVVTPEGLEGWVRAAETRPAADR